MNNNLTNSAYAFVLGREKEIALVELEATLRRLGFCFTKPIVTGNVAVINIENSKIDEVAKLSEILGGTIKIFRLLPPQTPPTLGGDKIGYSSPKVGEVGWGTIHNRNKLAMTISEIIKAEKVGQTGKINFGISVYSGDCKKSEIYTLGLEVKRLLKGVHSARFIESRQEDALSSIVSLKNDLAGRGIEIGLFELGNTYCSNEVRTNKTSDRDKDFSLRLPAVQAGSKNIGVGVLVGLSNPEKWSERDYEKPASDKYSGMVPHKLARAMVNIALGLRTQGLGLRNPETRAPSPETYVVLDPFCGSGNILMEAMMLGCDVVGSDKSEKAVRDTKANLEWLFEKNQELGIINQGKPQVFLSDATSNDLIANLDSCFTNHDSAVIVTEPYLGEPKKFMPSQSAAAGEYRKVKDIYLKFLENIVQLFNGSIARNNNRAIEQSNIVLCVVFPLIETTEKKRYSLYRESVDEIKSLGYIEERPPLIYGRDYQVVKREIVFLKYQATNTK